MRKLFLAFVCLFGLLDCKAQFANPEESLFLLPFQAPAGTYRIDENFEPAVAPDGWTTGSGITYNQTGISGMQGTYCMKIVSSGSAVSVTTASFTAYSEIWVYCLVQISSDVTCNMIELENASGSRAALFHLPGGGSGPRIYEGNVSQNIASALTMSQTYHCWIHWKSDHTADIGFSTDGVRPTSGFFYATVSGGDSGITTVSKIRLRADGSQTCYFDVVRVKTSQIGDNGI